MIVTYQLRNITPFIPFSTIIITVVSVFSQYDKQSPECGSIFVNTAGSEKND